MNYFLILVILGVSGGAYYMYSENQVDEQTITDLHHQVDDLNAKVAQAEAEAVAAKAVAEAAKKAAAAGRSGLPETPHSNSLSHGLPAASVMVPDTSHSSAIDAAADAAAAATNSAGIGTITTLDGHTYTNCKILKVEQDGVTFSHDNGITKILFALMQPATQKLFDYSPQKAVAQTDAQIRYDQQQNAASNTAPAAPAPATTNP